MELKPQLKQSQVLVMTPQLQQAIRLLQLNQIELRDEISHELENNPVLADDLTDPRPKERGDSAGGTDLPPEERIGVTERNEPQTDIADRIQEKKSAEVDWEQFLENRNQQQPMPASRGGYDELPPIEQNLTKLESLVDHLRWQINSSDLDEKDREFTELVLASLDDSGYLDTHAGYRETIAELEAALRHDPKARANVFNLGVVFEKIGRNDVAAAHFMRHLARDTSDEDRAFAVEMVSVLAPLVHDEHPISQLLSQLPDEVFHARELVAPLRSSKGSARQLGEAIHVLRDLSDLTTLRDLAGIGQSWLASIESLQAKLRGHDATLPSLEAIEHGLEKLRTIYPPSVQRNAALGSVVERCISEARDGSLTEALALAKRIDASDLDPRERARGEDYLHRVTEQLKEAGQHEVMFDAPESFLENQADKVGLSHERAREVLSIMQQLDPVGACTRDLRECLKVQAELYGYDDTEMAIIDRHLHNVEKRNWGAIARDLKVDTEEVIEAARQIQKLESRPARNFTTTDDKTNAITPDVYVSKDNDRWVVTDNDKGLQKLYINDQLAQKLLANKNAEKFISEKLRNAQWLIRAIEQRRRTIIRVTECIVEQQKDFFEKGVAHLRPMILRDIAEKVEMHESTISRVTTNKYVHTPQGLFELKYFFNSAIRRTADDDIASEAVKQAIKKIIESEDKDNPLSDQAIVEQLERVEGIQIARRTVAKYREVLGILASNKRKKMF
ncbi:MAG: RNA polymerase factor sigma-54 [Polyangiales bacterium]